MRCILLRSALLLMMLLLITGLQAQKKLYIQAKDATNSSFPLNEIRKVTFPSRTVIVYNNDGSTRSFPFVDLRQARFTYWLSGNTTGDQQENNAMTLFPNPVSEELTLRLVSKSSESVEIQVLDVNGNIVYNQMERVVPGSNQIKMQLSHLSRGLYVCRINKGKCIKTSKFLKN